MSTSTISDSTISLEQALAQISQLNFQNQSLQQKVQSLESELEQKVARESQLENEILELKATNVTPSTRNRQLAVADDDDELNELMIASSKKEKQKRKDIDDDLDSLDAAVKSVEEGKGNKKLDHNHHHHHHHDSNASKLNGNDGQANDEEGDDDHDQEDHEPRHRAYDEEDEELERQKRKREQEQQNRKSTSLHRKQPSREQLADDLAPLPRAEGSSVDAGFLESRQYNQTMEGHEFMVSASDENNSANNNNLLAFDNERVVPSVGASAQKNNSDPTSNSQLPSSEIMAGPLRDGSQQNLFAWMLASQMHQNAKSADNNNNNNNNNSNNNAMVNFVVTGDNDSIHQQQQNSKVNGMNANVFQYTPSMTSSTGGESQLSSPSSMMHQLTISTSSNNNNNATANNPNLLHPHYFANNAFNATLPPPAVGALQPLVSLQLQVENNNNNYLSSTNNNNRVMFVHPSRNNNGISDEPYTLLLENPSVADYLSAEDSRRFSTSTNTNQDESRSDPSRLFVTANAASELFQMHAASSSPLIVKDLNENSATLAPEKSNKNGEKSPEGASAEIGDKKEKKAKAVVATPTVQYPENTRCFKTQTRIEKSRSVAVTASYSDILMTMTGCAFGHENNNNNNQHGETRNANTNAATTSTTTTSSMKNAASSGSLPNGSLGSSMGLQESTQSNTNNNANSRSVSAGTTTAKRFCAVSSGGPGTSRNQDCDNNGDDDCEGEETPRTSDSLSSANAEIAQQQLQQQQQRQPTVTTFAENDEKEFVLASAQLAQEHLDRLQGLLDHVNSVVVKSTNLASRSVSCTNNGEK